MQKLSDVKLNKFLKKKIEVHRDGKTVVSGTLRSFWSEPPKTLDGYTDQLLVLWVDGNEQGTRCLKTDDFEGE